MKKIYFVALLLHFAVCATNRKVIDVTWQEEAF